MREVFASRQPTDFGIKQKSHMFRSYFFGQKLEKPVIFCPRTNEVDHFDRKSITSIKSRGRVFNARVYRCSEQSVSYQAKAIKWLSKVLSIYSFSLMLAWSVLCLIWEQTCWHTLAAMSSIRRRMVSLESETCWIFFFAPDPIIISTTFFWALLDKFFSSNMRLLTLRIAICHLVVAYKIALLPGRIVLFWQTEH